MEDKITGVVKHGAHVATGRGMPTANIKSVLDRGVYTAECEYGGCLVYVAKPPDTEIHIIGVENIDLYGEELKVWNIKRVPECITELACHINKESGYVN